MDIASILILFAAGCAAGILAGYLALDIGLFLVPLLLVWYGSAHVSGLVAIRLALGGSLPVACLMSVVTAYRSHREGFVVWPVVLKASAAGIIGAVGGTFLAGLLKVETLTQLFGLAAFVAGVQMFVIRRKPKDIRFEPPLALLKLNAYGVLAGMVAAFTSTGNYLLTQPLLYKQLHIQLKRSIGTATAMSAIVFASAGIAYLFGGSNPSTIPQFSMGYVDFLRILPLSAGAVLCAGIGRRLNETGPARNVRVVTGILLIGMAIKLVVAP